MSSRDASEVVNPAEDRARPSGRRNPDAVELYKLIHAEAVRLLKDQQDELSTVRTRTVQYLALIGTATAFLAGTALRGGSRDAGFYFAAGASTAAFVLTLLLGMQVLTGLVRQAPDFMRRAGDGDEQTGQPAVVEAGASTSGTVRAKKRWHTPEPTFHSSPTRLSYYADTPVVGQDRYFDHVAMLKRVSVNAEKWHDENERFIRLLKRSYQLCIAAGFLQLLFWLATAWRFGGAPPA